MIARGRFRVSGMNKTESSYAGELDLRVRAGEIAWYRYNGWTFKLADDTRYTPDFAVMLSSGELEAHEVKGWWREDAKVKIKVAAGIYPIRFIAVRKIRGGFTVEEF